MRNKNRSFVILLLILVSAGSVFAEVANRIVAIVNNEIITYYELEKAFKNLHPADREKGTQEEIKKQLLFQLIDQKLVELQIKRLGIQISSEDLEKSLDRIKQEQGLSRPEDFQAALAKGGVSEADIKNRIKEQLLRFRLVSREIGSKIVVPELKIQEYFQKHKSLFQKSEGVHLAQIVLTNPDNASSLEVLNQKMKAEAIWERLKKGEDFADLARSFSLDASGAQGGDLGFFGWDEIDPSLKTVIASLKPGEFSQVLQSPQGWQIVKLIALQVAKEVSLEEVREQIREKLFQEEVEIRFGQWVQQLKDRSYIQVLL
jgi:peptidyl-prolyl cis-trans isomerase SurA